MLHSGSLLKRRPSVILVLTCPLGTAQEAALEWGLLCWRQRWPSLRLSASSGLCWLQRQRWGSVSYIWCAHTVHDMHVFSWYFCDNSYGMVCCTAGSFGSCDSCHSEAQERCVCQVWGTEYDLVPACSSFTHEDIHWLFIQCILPTLVDCDCNWPSICYPLPLYYHVDALYQTVR